MTLFSRLIFGTARLAGGAYARRSCRLIEACLDSGITAFDTAPSYGMGAAEGLLGEVCGDVPGISLHTKAGSPRPRNPSLLGWLKQARGVLPRSESALPVRFQDYTGPAPGFAYGAPVLSASLERSRALLRRDRIDLLLLHEAEPDDVPDAGWGVFEDALSNGSVKTIGYAHYGPPRCLTGGLNVQVAPRPDDFARAATGTRIWHSVRLASEFALHQGGAGSAAIESACHKFRLDSSGPTDRLVAGMATLAIADSQARLIFATSDRARLRAVLARLAAIAPEIDAA